MNTYSMLNARWLTLRNEVSASTSDEEFRRRCRAVAQAAVEGNVRCLQAGNSSLSAFLHCRHSRGFGEPREGSLSPDVAAFALNACRFFVYACERTDLGEHDGALDEAYLVALEVLADAELLLGFKLVEDTP